MNGSTYIVQWATELRFKDVYINNNEFDSYIYNMNIYIYEFNMNCQLNSVLFI